MKRNFIPHTVKLQKSKKWDPGAKKRIKETQQKIPEIDPGTIETQYLIKSCILKISEKKV